MLDTFCVPRLANQRLREMGMDSLDQCRDPVHWQKYPHTIEYVFNDRGYRDQPWPSDLDRAVWCIGDSFTQGLGSPWTHTWPVVLSELMNYPVIVVSMNGASNDWMARKTAELLAEIQPRAVAIQWSYIHRREVAVDLTVLQDLNNQLWQDFYQTIKDDSWPRCDTLENFISLPQRIQHEILTQHYSHHLSSWFGSNGELKLTENLDEERMQHFQQHSTSAQDVKNAIDCVTHTHQLCQQHSVPVVSGFIPDFAAGPDRLSVLQHIPQPCWGEAPRLDLARDGHHYDRVTAEYVAQQFARHLTGAIV